MNITICKSTNDIASCWEAMSILRPNLESATFVEQVKIQQEEGYVLITISEHEKVVALAGYRLMNLLYCGKILYIDDLITLPECRGKGYAGKLLVYIDEVAKNNTCKSIQLDSGHTRYDAHKLYFKSGFTISAFHFQKEN